MGFEVQAFRVFLVGVKDFQLGACVGGSHTQSYSISRLDV